MIREHVGFRPKYLVDALKVEASVLKGVKIGCINHLTVGQTSAPLRAPKWYKRKAGVSFGFGGKLVSFHSTDASAGSSEVHLHNVLTEQSLVSRSSDFEAAIQNGERSSLRVLCDKKSQESESEDERETWGFLKVMFEDDGTARTKLLTHLGFSLPAEGKDAVQDDLSQEISALGLEERVADKEGYVEDKETTISPLDNGEDFFNNLPSPKADTPVSTSGNNFVRGGPVPAGEEMQHELDGQEETIDPSFDDDVQRALVVGDYKGAVVQCITANRMADALVIAHVGGASLWEKTRDQYLKMSHSSYLKVVSAMVNNDVMSLVNTRPLKSWKETLALLCTFAQREEWTLLCDTLASRLMAAGNTLAATLCYICAGNIDKTVEIWSKSLATEHDGKSYVDLLQFAQREEWTLLCDTLASRLMAAGNTLAATLCYICAGNIDKTVEIWSKSLATEHDGKSYVDLLQDLMEKTIVLALATGQKRFSASVCKLVEKYAEILASQGLLTTAMEYLKLMGTEELSPELTILRDRIALSTEPDKEVPNTMAFENSQPQPGAVYAADQSSYGAVDASQNYYQETAPSQLPPSIPNSPYGDSYQSSFGAPYGRGYGATPAPYQTAQQPNMFIPSQAPQVPPVNFVQQPPAPTQPAITPFVPSTPPALRNVEQYQQPSLGSQLYSGNTNPSYQAGPPGVGSLGPMTSHVGPTPGHKMPPVAAPTPASRGFMPITTPGTHRPGMGPVQPPNPTQSVPAQPAVAPAAPPPTVQTADTSNVPAHQRPVITTLMRLFNETFEALGGSRANPARKREIEDNSKRIGALFAKLNSGDISKNAGEKLVLLCQALDNGDFSTALQIQVQLTTSDWDECNFWLNTLKRMIKTRQNVR
ncbi:unnamed protein product [Ilex paraguariensis]|uniref:Ancestral coatomer element 1 Sec16/Sec31 domain-containing protein n=1 Tax=Ilex paraguariensis TaxID=185542 RepID=A0ABC8RRR5_9AQUA